MPTTMFRSSASSSRRAQRPRFSITLRVAAALLAASAGACQFGSPPKTAPTPVAQGAGGEGEAAFDVSPYLPPDGPHPFSVRDLWAMERVSSPVVSPDGTRVVYVLTRTDFAENGTKRALWSVRLSDPKPSMLIDDARDPAFSRDGAHVFFLSARSGSTQVWRLPTQGGEAEQVTRLPVDVEGYLLSPQGDKLVVAASTYPDCPDLTCTAERLKAGETGPSGMVYERMFVRHWDTWKDGRRGHLFVLPLGDGEATDLTRGLDADVPSRPFGGMEEVQFSPDGQGLVFSARDAKGGGGEPWSTNFDLYYVKVAGDAEPERLTDNPAWDTHPVFSPDGGTLAYLAMQRAGYEADRFRIVLRDLASGQERVLADEWDRSVSELVFARDGKSLFATAHDTGQKPVFAIDVQSGSVAKLHAEGTHSGLSVGNDRLVFLRNDLAHPNELWMSELNGENSQRLTQHNDARLEDVAFGAYEQFSFSGHGGEKVHGFIVRPANFEEGKKYPLAFLIHGGPQGSLGNLFHYRWNPQTYAGQGYVAVAIDFHGSVGYGQKFTDSIRKDWGGKPLTDLKLGLAAAVKKYSFIDQSRACALGASYGGFMVNWIAGRWPERFRCLVNHDGVFDQRMMYYTTEELWFPEWENGGPYHQRAEVYERANPVNHVAKWKTPMLVIQGAQDFRVPLGQGLATFTALQRREIPSKLIVFPDENHWVLKPQNGVQWHDEVNAWLDAHLKEPE